MHGVISHKKGIVERRMKGWLVTAGVIVFLSILIAGIPAVILQIEIDQCLDSGGKFLYETEACTYDQSL